MTDKVHDVVFSHKETLNHPNVAAVSLSSSGDNIVASRYNIYEDNLKHTKHFSNSLAAEEIFKPHDMKVNIQLRFF